MFVTHGIPSFFELVRKCVYNFSQQISLRSNFITTACLAPFVFIHSPSDNGGDQYYILIFFLTVIYLFIDGMYVFLIIMFLLCIWTNVWNKKLLLLLLILELRYCALGILKKSFTCRKQFFYLGGNI